MGESKRSEVLQYNATMWDRKVVSGSRWTIPVGSDEIAQARAGEPQIVLTPQKKVPQNWLSNLKGKDVLMLASGGGQQTPIIAATGANVTVLDISPNQLERDQEVADREGLTIRTVEGSMDDLLMFDDESFDLIIHPCSNTFVPDVKPVWKESARVLRVGGEMISGFCNPLIFVFDYKPMTEGKLVARFSIPYSDLADLPEDEIKAFAEMEEAYCFGHTLADLLGSQAAAGLHIVDLYEDYWGAGEFEAMDKHIASFIATRSRKCAKV
ncbi:MAG: methyltransferase domain-containing protein [Pirellulaceae bacterium]